MPVQCILHSLSSGRSARYHHALSVGTACGASPSVAGAAASAATLLWQRRRRPCGGYELHAPSCRFLTCARRGRGDVELPEASSRPAGRDAAGLESDDHRSEVDRKPRKSGTRRRQFGPEPPPQPQAAASQAVAAESPDLPAGLGGEPKSETGGVVAAAPKRRGRPPKPRQVSSGEAAPEPAGAASTTSPQHSATAAISRTKAPRKAFGPEPPPPSQSAPAASDPLLALPSDPSKLTPEDILDVPLPDQLAAGGLLDPDDMLLDTDLLEGAAEEDLDFDDLIALASRVDAARYVERAFERAKQGLDPTPDPLAADNDEDAVVAAEFKDVSDRSPRPERTASVAGAATTSTANTRTRSSSSGTNTSSPRTTSIPIPAQHQQPAPSATSSPASSRSSRPSTTTATYVDSQLLTSAGGNSATATSESPASSEEAAAEAAGQRRVAVLVDLLGASGTELEAKLEAVAPEVDEQMLVLLERRYTAALQLGQDPALTERIEALYRALRYVYQRRTSTPAERLLDDVLEILGDEQLQPNVERRRMDAAMRLRNAFTGGMLDVDVFTAAAALAEQRQAAADALAGEQVPVEVFKAEALGLLDHAKRVQQQTAESLEVVEAEVARLRREEPAALEGSEWKQRLEQVALAREALTERKGSIDALEEVLVLTRAIEMQMLTGRMR